MKGKRRKTTGLLNMISLGNFNGDFGLSLREFYALGLFISKLRAQNNFINMPVVGAHCIGYNSQLLFDSDFNGCTAGISSIGITSDGNIVGCLSMGNDRFFEGNIRERSLTSIWNDRNSFTYNRHSSEKRPGQNCQRCPHFTMYKGGCNSVSYSYTNRFHNDPYCFYRIEQEVLTDKELSLLSIKK